MKIAALIFGAISELWGLIFKLAIVVIVIVAAVAFVKSCAANATLSEHSSCQQFSQADTTTQDKVLRDMMTAHHDPLPSLSVTRFSVTLYCDTHDDSSPIDGVYNSSDAGWPAP